MHSFQFQTIDIIKKYISRGSPIEGLILYKRVRPLTIHVFTLLPLVLKACAAIPSLEAGKALHCDSLKQGSASDLLVGTSLLGMYARCNDMRASSTVFEEMPHRSVITWNAIIGGFMKNGDARTASCLFEKMGRKSLVSWVEMIDGFGKMGDTGRARKVFNQVPDNLKNTKIWTAMVGGYAWNGEMEAARSIFELVPEKNCFTWSVMITGYCRIGKVNEATQLFDRVPRRSLEIWNSLISGYARNGFCEEAIRNFFQMQATDGIEPDHITLSSVLSACAQLARLDIGKHIHAGIVRRGMKLNTFVSNALLDMYAKCGDLANAKAVFKQTEHPNVTCYNSMISGLAIHGHSREAMDVFKAMEDTSITPDDITFLSVLCACAHGGFLGEGMIILRKMEKYGLRASVKHYGCVVDLLGRSGRLLEAYEMAKNMPVRPNNTVLGALVGACKAYNSLALAEKVGGACSGDESYHVVVSSIYAWLNRWEEAEAMRAKMVGKGLRKTAGCSWLVV